MFRRQFSSACKLNSYSSSSFKTSLKQQPPDPILSLKTEYEKDLRGEKIYLGVGELMGDDGKQPKFTSVINAERQLWPNGVTEKQYTPILGRPRFHNMFLNRLIQLGFPERIMQRSVCAVTPGGTGALALANRLISLMGPSNKKVWIPSMTWPNHVKIFNTESRYDYLNEAMTTDGLAERVKNCPTSSGDYILLHACCHNPTGVDVDMSELAKLALVIKVKGLTPIIDAAYIGLATSVSSDVRRLLPFYELFGDKMFVCFSFSKNMGLYGQRVGLLTVMCKEAEKDIVSSNLALEARGLWSNPPNIGALIAETVLSNDDMFDEWVRDVDRWALCLKQKRALLASRLTFPSPHIVDGNGLFTVVKMDTQKCADVKKNNGVYMVNIGSHSRLNVCAITERNVGRITDTINNLD
jgi:aspartate/tyrosine/aromatic aminotransferase